MLVFCFSFPLIVESLFIEEDKLSVIFVSAIDPVNLDHVSTVLAGVNTIYVTSVVGRDHKFKKSLRNGGL